MKKMMSFPTQHTIKHNSVDFKFGGNVNYFEKKKKDRISLGCMHKPCSISNPQIHKKNSESEKCISRVSFLKS